MKLLTVILSLYVFVLAAMPCIDEGENNSVTYSLKKDNHSHDKENDLCSPFCICSCCSGVTLLYETAIAYEFQKEFEGIKTSNSFYTSTLHSNFYGNIWQPPKIN